MSIVARCCAWIFVATLIVLVAAQAKAQHQTSKTYPARQNIRLQLMNRSGSILVEGWGRNEIKVTANMESSVPVVPQITEHGLIIDLMQETRGRADIGDVNFRVQVPTNSTVDLETKRGNITVHNVQGSLVRARVSSEGDIELTGIKAATVMARNTLGNILFDGELMAGGTYDLTTVEGDTSIRLPGNIGFFLTAAAFTRRIDLGGFASMGKCNSVSNNRKVICKMGDGAAHFNVTNHRGPITFMKR